MNPWTDYYRFTCTADDEPAVAELLIFDAIGNWEEIGEVSAKAFARDLAGLPNSVKRINLHINSPGGSLFDASAIYSRLADHPSNKHVYIDGLAASAASIVAMVGHKIYIRANAQMMIHAPGGVAIGTAEDMRRMASALDSINESMINVYAKRTGQTRDALRTMLAAETWLSPEAAVEKGFADEVRGVVKAAAMVGPNRAIFNGVEFDLRHCRNVPAFNAQHTQQPTTEGTTDMPQANPAPPPSAPGAPQAPAPGTSQPHPGTEQPAPHKPTPSPQSEPAPPRQPPQSEPEEAENAVARERQRVAALMELDRPHTRGIVAAAIKDGRQASDIIGELMQAMDNASRVGDRRSDASVLDDIPGSDGGANGGNRAEDYGTRLTAAVQARVKARGQRSPLHGHN